MRKNSFTIVELVVVIVVIGILVTLSLPNFLNYIENSKSKVCEVNLRALKIALDAYAMEHDVMPASLSQLPVSYRKNAYAAVMHQEGSWKIKIAQFIIDWESRGKAYAAPFIQGLAGGDTTLLRCPADDDVSSHGGISYGVNQAIANKSSIDYQAISGDTLLIADCDNATFSNDASLSARHKQYALTLGGPDYTANGIQKDRKVSKKHGKIPSSKLSRSLRDRSRDNDNDNDNNDDD